MMVSKMWILVLFLVRDIVVVRRIENLKHDTGRSLELYCHYLIFGSEEVFYYVIIMILIIITNIIYAQKSGQIHYKIVECVM